MAKRKPHHEDLRTPEPIVLGVRHRPYCRRHRDGSNRTKERLRPATKHETTISATKAMAMMTRARTSSPGLGQFNARYSANSLRALRIAIQSTAIVNGLATMRAAPYQCPCIVNA